MVKYLLLFSFVSLAYFFQLSDMQGQRFDFGVGGSIGFGQIDGDGLFGFDKLVGKVYLQSNYNINSQTGISVKLGYGQIGSESNGGFAGVNTEEAKIAMDINDISSIFYIFHAFGGSLNKSGRRSKKIVNSEKSVIQLGVGFHRFSKISLPLNDNIFLASFQFVDIANINTSGYSINAEYMYRITPKDHLMLGYEYFATSILRNEIYNINRLIPLSIQFGYYRKLF